MKDRPAASAAETVGENKSRGLKKSGFRIEFWLYTNTAESVCAPLTGIFGMQRGAKERGQVWLCDIARRLAAGVAALRIGAVLQQGYGYPLVAALGRPVQCCPRGKRE